MKTNSNFKLNREVKRFLCLMKDQSKASEFKRIFIDAQLSEESSKKKINKNESADVE